MVSLVSVTFNGTSISVNDRHKMKGFISAVIYTVAIRLNIAQLSLSYKLGLDDSYISEHTANVFEYENYYGVDKLRRDDFEDDDFFEWLNPTDGYLAARDTPIYFIQGNGSNSTPKITSYALGKYLNDMYSSSDKATVDSFIEKTKRQHRRGHNVRNTMVDTITLYPEILVAIDYSLVKLFKGNIVKILTYTLAFWNSVDMRYRTIVDPKIRLNIAGIVIAEDDYNFSYQGYSHIVDAYSFNGYDMIIQLTACELCNNNYSNKYNDFPELSCHSERHSSNTVKPSIVYDDSGFGGILAAAHVLGQLLGMSYNGGNKDGRCSHSDDTMGNADNYFVENTSKWSSCALKNLQNFVRNNDVSCLYNNPPIRGKSAKRFFSGKLVSAYYQCKLRGKMRAPKSEKNCTTLTCLPYRKASRDEMRLFPVGDDGKACGIGKICLRNQCI